MRKKQVGLLSIAGAIVVASAAGCGSGTEPLSAFSTSDVTPQLSLPIANATTTVSQILPFSESGNGTSRDGFDIQMALAGQTVLAPGPGIVTYVDSTAGASVVYVYHNAHLLSRVSQMQASSVQPGAVVQAGSAIGLSSSTNATAVHFSVFFDNSIVCPLSYLTFGDQNKVYTRLSGQSPCY